MLDLVNQKTTMQKFGRISTELVWSQVLFFFFKSTLYLTFIATYLISIYYVQNQFLTFIKLNKVIMQL